MPGTVISPLHASILKTGTLLGYFSDNPIGCCNGFTLKWLSACLVGEEAKFNQRVKTILNDEHLIENINRVKEKIKHGGEALQEDKDYLEILEFYEGMLLFQSPFEHPEILGSGVSQLDFELMSPLASSDQMNELGGLVTVNSDIGLYTKEGIENYLNNLAKRIDDTNYDSVDPIGFHLVCHNHAVGLTYNKTTHQWTFKDTNNAASLLNQDLLTTKEISREIFKGFKPAPSEELIESMLDGLSKDLKTGEFRIGSSFTYNGKTAELSYQKKPEKWTLNGKSITKQDAVQGVYRIFHGEKSLSPYVAFSTSTITTAKHEKKFNLQAQLRSFKTPLHITAELIHMNACNELIEVAVSAKREDVIIELLDYGMDVNQRLNDMNSTLTHQASQFGLIGVLEALAAHHANFNAVTLGGYTSLMCAVEYRQHDVIHWLLKHDVDLDAQMTSGATAMYFAAQKGNVEIIHALAERGAKLDIPLLKSFSTPILVAASNGHLQAIDALIEHGVNINAQMANGQTVVYLAAEYGLVQALSPLANRGANLDIPDNKGHSPAWRAACNGHLSVLRELVKYNANMNTPNTEGTTPLFMAAQQGHADVVNYLLENSQSQSVSFLSSTDSLENFAKSRGEAVIRRMDEIIAFKLSKGADKDHIPLLPQDIAWIMDHQEMMQAFSVISENEIKRAPLRASIIAAILTAPKKDEWRAELPENVNPVDFAFMQLEIKQQGLNVEYHERHGHQPAHLSITRPEASKRIKIGSTDPHWQTVNTAFAQLFNDETARIRYELQKKLSEHPTDNCWRFNLKNNNDSPFNQDAIDAIQAELVAEGFSVTPIDIENIYGTKTVNAYFSITRPKATEPTTDNMYSSLLQPQMNEFSDPNEREKIAIRAEIKALIKDNLYDSHWNFQHFNTVKCRFNSDVVEAIKSELKSEGFTVNYKSSEQTRAAEIPPYLEITPPTFPLMANSTAIYTDILPRPTDDMIKTKKKFKSVSESYLLKLGKDLKNYKSLNNGKTTYCEPDKKDTLDLLAWKKYIIVESALKELDNPKRYPMDQMRAFQETLTKKENVDILAQRRDSWLVNAAKIVSTLGTILIYRWLMGDKVTEGARNEKSITAKYKELLASEKLDSLKNPASIIDSPDDSGSPHISENSPKF